MIHWPSMLIHDFLRKSEHGHQALAGGNGSWRELHDAGDQHGLGELQDDARTSPF